MHKLHIGPNKKLVTGGIAVKNLDNNNNIKNMIVSGSKGNFINISQIMSCVGQQNVTSGKKNGRI